jgi:hypothetical protein
MRFKVPQNIDIEDKIVGPLTGKQFLWLLGGAVIMLLIWRLVDFSLFIAFSVVIMGTMCAFAFIRPYQQNMIVFLGNIFLYSSKGKQFLWKKEVGPVEKRLSRKPEEEIIIVKKSFSYKEAEKLAKTLDSQEK